MAQTPPQIPAGVRALMNQPCNLSGAWNSPMKSTAACQCKPLQFLPRHLAIRLNDKTAVRATLPDTQCRR
jgi:hypothetical protein